MTTPSKAASSFDAARSVLVQMVQRAPVKTALAATLMLVLIFTEGVNVLLLAPLLERVGVMEQSPMPSAARWLVSGLARVGIEATLGSVLLVFVGVAALRAVARHWQTRLISRVREDLVRSYRTRLYEAMVGAEWRFLVTRTPSEFAVALTSEVGRVGMVVTQITDVVVLSLVSLVYVAIALRLSAPLTLLTLGCALVLAGFVRGTLGRARRLGTRGAAARNRLQTAIAEHVASIKTARCYGTLERHTAEFDRLSLESVDVGLEVAAAEVVLQQRLEFGSTLLLALVVYVSAEIVPVPPALLLVLLFVFARLMPRLVNIYRIAQGLAMALPVVDAVNQLEQECLAAAEPTVEQAADVSLADGIRFDGVSFTYARRHDRPAIQRVSLAIAAGTTTAIVGASGSGKTTLADLLMGLLSPGEGVISVGGTPLNATTLASWRRQIGYVPQDTFLFHDTVRANLLWASPSASDDELLEALETAAADVFVRALPQGLDTVIGERGVLLSGGERQRLAIARALLRRPRVLLLDEATSSLDFDTERRIHEALARQSRSLTLVVITHRLSAIRDAARIHVVDDGRVVASGTWQELSFRGELPPSMPAAVDRQGVGQPA